MKNKRNFRIGDLVRYRSVFNPNKTQTQLLKIVQVHFDTPLRMYSLAGQDGELITKAAMETEMEEV